MVPSLNHHLICFSRSSRSRLCSNYIFHSRAPYKTFPIFRSNILFSGSARRNYGSGPNPNPGQNPVQFWPFLAITLLGSGAYILMVKSRTEMSAPSKNNSSFSSAKVAVVFVLGGPGAGKGTQCDKLVRDYQFIHLSAGDLLRAEQDREGSEFGDLIKNYIKEGKIVPMEVTNKLLENTMAEAVKNSTNGTAKFLIDGFPRKMDQALKFEEAVCQAKLVLFFDCPEQELQKRLLKRGETSGRSDDNIETIAKRFKTFIESSMPVVEHFKSQNRVITIDATRTPEEVYAETCDKLKEWQII